ncbi:zf-HC2 domain-containing protein [Planotetraspora sp. A-T 1434]|uniref:anti-sigma factor family protein n=1 Tax=Planotetraspora sp. A-T 1434 TaxID=2979219 RepID=UPI0021BEA92D|nr:zf-HC2 domain-containing protein [Planotetraspora sp. A-T 1434]MCT9934755.1 zf-HC2 domain-containing protein [Planotetraspora sp. A-T 1434]
MTCDDVRMSLGAYVLGALDDDEIAEVEEHLDRCPACRAELAELSGLPPVLARVSEEDIQHAGTPPRAVLDRLVAASARRNRRSRVLLALAASVVVAALGGTAWLSTVHTESPRTSAALSGPAQAEQAPPDAAGGSAGTADSRIGDPNPLTAPASPGPYVDMKVPSVEHVGKNGKFRLEVRLTPEEGGTAVMAEVYGVPVGTHCQLRAIGFGGAVSPAGSWTVAAADYRGRKAEFGGSTDLQMGEIQRFELLTSTGRILVTVPM